MQTLKHIVEHGLFRWSIVGLIVLNFFVLLASTNGFDTVLIEDLILGVFLIEIILKLLVYRGAFWFDSWNIFDFVIIGLSILPWVGIPIPPALAGLRTLRLVRILSVVPMFRPIIGAIGRSIVKMTAVMGMLAVTFPITALMATLSFQSYGIESFSSFTASLLTLAQLAMFDNVGEIVSEAGSANLFGAILTFSFFFVAVVLVTLNLFIGILANALADEEREWEEN